MTIFHTQVATAADAISIRKGWRYLWLGTPSPQLPLKLRCSLDDEQLREQMLITMQSQLYRDFYCHGGSPAQDTSAPPARRDQAFLDQLSAANSGLGRFEEGWQIEDVAADGQLHASREGFTLLADLQETDLGSSEPVEAGDPVGLMYPKESHFGSPGFYFAYSDTALPEGANPELRLYWNVNPTSAIQLVSRVTSLFNDEGIPFALKVVNNPRHYDRCDAAVLYLTRASWPQARRLVIAIYETLGDGLHANTPALTKRLHSGLAVAESPTNGDSFGLHRCRLVADGLVRAYEEHRNNSAGRVCAVAERFAEDGLDLGMPYLNPGSEEIDDDLWTHANPHKGGRRRALPERDSLHEHTSTDAFIDAAQQLGHRLAQSAVWNGDQCCWIGPELAVMGEARPASWRPIGCDLYTGTAGVGSFLTDLAMVTGDLTVRRAAVGALTHATHYADLALDTTSLYTGRVGVALAAARAARIFDLPQLATRAVRLITDAPDRGHGTTEFDMINGEAGTVVGLLAIATQLEIPELAEAAAIHGVRLLKLGQTDQSGMYWVGPDWLQRKALTGLSHGAAGASIAFTELYSKTGDGLWRDAAIAAMTFEERWFDPSVGNWRDLRGFPGHGPFMTAWCHGAPGIALSRIRAHQVFGSGVASQFHLDEALRTTQKATEDTLDRGIEDFSLCHGLAGNADVLLEAAKAGINSSGLESALRVGDWGIRSYAQGGRPWPCGTAGSESPGLMLGLAGIGGFYLRLGGLADTPLLITSELRNDNLPTVSITATNATHHTTEPNKTAADDLRFPRIANLRPGFTAGLIRIHLRSRGYTGQHHASQSTAETRWTQGTRLQRRLITARLPTYVQTGDLVDLSQVDAHLWHSLPTMLTFGWEQAHALAQLNDTPSHLLDDAASACAIFSSLLSVFDHLVDEGGKSDEVFALEPEALKSLQSPEGDAALSRLYLRTTDPQLHLLIVLFDLLRADLARLRGISTPVAWAQLHQLIGTLFAAERQSTLVRPTDLSQLAELALKSEAKSILPFLTLLHILSLTGPHEEPTESAAAAANYIGTAICQTDDIVDLFEDLQHRSPSPLVSRVTRLAYGHGRGPLSLMDVMPLLHREITQLCDFLRLDTDGQELTSIDRFTRATIERWIGWPPTSAHQVRNPVRRPIDDRLLRQISHQSSRGLSPATRMLVLTALMEASTWGGVDVSNADIAREALDLLLHEDLLTDNSLRYLLRRALVMLDGIELASAVPDLIPPGQESNSDDLVQIVANLKRTDHWAFPGLGQLDQAQEINRPALQGPRPVRRASTTIPPSEKATGIAALQLIRDLNSHQPAVTDTPSPTSPCPTY